MAGKRGRSRGATWWAAVLAGALGLAGCGKPEPRPAAAVRGVVTYQGVPLAGGMVVFAPCREKGTVGKSVSATVATDGGFRLAVEGADAVVPGWYRVALADPPGVFTEAAGYPRFPAALRRPDKSGLEREVVAGKDNVFVFQVEVPTGP
ncbi:hypothetical protein [Fimbriiglobus ruber]|uniref:Carboxypeptidase regulatory-like domain-containing protein n=1 Tax=Fimbriiglobus ruber TaxID=1908690 RepID=A0A225DQR2_9BACT|nr:hypothetical protein [Fimbriiglobus ruber]OWK43433.1 hypothetical protein FRUB_03032 [Fimbriiglobus ruber]